MNDQEVLSALLEYTRRTINGLANDIGKSAQTLYDIKKGRNGFSKSLADAICHRFPNVNKSWLLTGNGPMLLEDGLVIRSKINDYQENEFPIKLEDGKIPLLPFSAAAGFMAGGNGSDTFQGDVVQFADFTERGADCAVRVEGDSMIPRYSGGDILAIKILKDPTFFQWGRVYVLNTTQGCIIKKLFPDPSDDTKIICHSENSELYPDYKITKEDILGVAIVVGHAGTE